MPSTLILKRTYDPSDCTSVGWAFEWHAGRLMAEKRNRWQGARDGIRVFIGKMSLKDARKWIKEELPNILKDQRDDFQYLYPVTNKGYWVR